MSNPLPPRRSGLRKRKTPDANSENEGGLAKLLAAAAACNKLVVFSGSGLSANSGMSTFSTPGGLYERAQAKFHVADGKKLFTYSFYEKRKLDALAFFADIYTEAKKAAAGAGHKAIADIYAQGKLVRHYTLNIDGLAEAEGMPTWHPHHNPAGVTVEMHGSIRQLVCPDCGLVIPMSPFLLKRLKRRENIPCTCCQCTSIRIRIMLYDDAEDGVITPEDLYDRMDEDVKSADMILWVGLSFEQSASTAYFRRVRHYLNEVGRLDVCRQVVINPSDESLWNLLSACSNIGSLDVVEVLASSEEVLPMVAAAMATTPPAPALQSPAAASAPADQQRADASSAHAAQEPRLEQPGALNESAAAGVPQGQAASAPAAKVSRLDQPNVAAEPSASVRVGEATCASAAADIGPEQQGAAASMRRADDTPASASDASHCMPHAAPGDPQQRHWTSAAAASAASAQEGNAAQHRAPAQAERQPAAATAAHSLAASASEASCGPNAAPQSSLPPAAACTGRPGEPGNAAPQGTLPVVAAVAVSRIPAAESGIPPAAGGAGRPGVIAAPQPQGVDGTNVAAAGVAAGAAQARHLPGVHHTAAHLIGERLPIAS